MITYNFAPALFDLTCNSTATVVRDDYIYQGTSPKTAEGIVVKIIDGTHLTVATYNGTFLALPTTTYDQDGHSFTVSASIATAQIDVPTYVMMVEGSDSSKTNNFYQIGNAAAAGVTAPTLINQWIGLNMGIYIGYRGQSAETYIIFEEEMPDFSGGAYNWTRCASTSTYASKVRFGNAFYAGGSIQTPYAPPTMTEKGCKIRTMYNTDNSARWLSVDANSTIYRYDTTFTNPNHDFTNWESADIYGTDYMAHCTTEWQDLYNMASTALWYWSDVKLQNLIDYLIPSSLPQYFDKVVMTNTAGEFIFALSQEFEAVISGLKVQNDNGELQAYYGQANANTIVHTRNSELPPKVNDSWLNLSGVVKLLNEIDLDLKVTDIFGTAISGANIRVLFNGNNILFKKLIAKNNAGWTGTETSITPSTTQTFTLSPDNSELTAGSSLVRLGGELMLDISHPNSTQVIFQRCQVGTYVTAGYSCFGERHPLSYGTPYESFYLVTIGVSDANGKLYETGTTLYRLHYHSYYQRGGVGRQGYVDFINVILEVSKSGYKTVKIPLTLSGSFPLVIPITLEKIKDLNFSKRAKIKTQ